MPGSLRRSDPSTPGWTRRRAGAGWSFRDASGQVLRGEARQRCLDLVLPPAWTDVWICPDEWGHIQATGVDARGRRQYRYHEAWRDQRSAEKFDRVLRFAEALLEARPRLADALRGEGLGRERVLACAVRLLDLGFFRVGGEEYAEENQTYGLATMRKEHVRVTAEAVEFEYTAKSGKHRLQSLADGDVRDVVAGLKRRRGGGPELLAYRDDDGAWRDVRSTEVNEAVRHWLGDDFTAKDFRTWSATVLAAVGLAVSAAAAQGSERQRAQAVTRAVQEVARYLGNTPAVARSSYVDPRVVQLFAAGKTLPPDVLALLGSPGDPGQPGVHGAVERAVLELLRAADAAGPEAEASVAGLLEPLDDEEAEELADRLDA